MSHHRAVFFRLAEEKSEMTSPNAAAASETATTVESAATLQRTTEASFARAGRSGMLRPLDGQLAHRCAPHRCLIISAPVRVQPPGSFVDVAPDMVHSPSGLRVWFTEPLGMLTQVTEQRRADLAMARFLSGPATERLFSLREDPSQKLWFLHEWSAMVGYTKETRNEMTQWGLSVRRDVERIVVHLGTDAPALVRMGVSVASTALALAGIRLDMTQDMEASLTRWNIRPRGR